MDFRLPPKNPLTLVTGSVKYEEICDDTCLSKIEAKRALTILNGLNLIEMKIEIVKGQTEINIKVNESEYERLKADKGL